MTATAILEEVKARGGEVRLTADGALRYRAPKAEVEAVGALLRAHKPEIITMLRTEIHMAELSAQRRLDDAFTTWREHVIECPGCDRADPARRCDAGRQFAAVYHQAWRQVYVVPFGEERREADRAR